MTSALILPNAFCQRAVCFGPSKLTLYKITPIMISCLKLLPLAFLLFSCAEKKKTSEPLLASNAEPHRPQIHFTPQKAWMNDPNGLVQHNGTYHLFYQHYPDSTVWGPMHWAHATSNDLLHWQHQPVALYPDSLGYIFSGSAVVDSMNTSGFGENGKTPLVAIFTQHDPKGEKNNRNDYQTQGIAYSLDEGKTWAKYAGNPVLKNPGLRDFRDPKVSWYEDGKKWIMTLATGDRITFYSSPDLKAWKKKSEFGTGVGAHGGVWECPDLFPMAYNGEKHWVLLVSINPGGPNGGSATQYFVGNFDGGTFTPFATDTRWVDYGPDDYAGVTYANTGDRRIFLGWMSNWQYATVVPTKAWRSAMTMPRELRLQKVGEKFLLSSEPVKELDGLAEEAINVTNSAKGSLNGPAKLQLKAPLAANFTLALSNAAGQKLVVGYDKASNEYFIDRTASGKVDFEKGFARRHMAPRLSERKELELTLVIDRASVELFADDGLTAMTEIFFPGSDYTAYALEAGGDFKWETFQYTKLKSTYDDTRP